ncbi:MAG: Spy/CpxP family protein refolding chaperone [Lentisphaerae bacterium]|nr:Spy/CpxP family protein refolding chaperone [Lentisphaerota bacterium]
MKKNLFLALLAALVLGILAFSLTRWTVCARHGTLAAQVLPSRLEDISFLTKELRLEPEQVRELTKLHAALATKLSDCCQRHCAVRARLGPALGNETNGMVQAKMMIAEMCRSYEEGELATLEHIQHVRAILNQEQKRRFDELIAECLCRTCAVCGQGAAKR